MALRTVEEVASSVLAEIAARTTIGPLNVLLWINERYQQMVRTTKFHHLRRKFSVMQQAPLSSGTCTTTLGSTQVIGVTGANGTLWTTAQVGWYFRQQFTWYRVQSVDSANQILNLASPYTDAQTSGSNLSYMLVERYIPLPPEVRWIVRVVNQRTGRNLRMRSIDWLDKKYPDRLLVGPWPVYWAEGPAYDSITPTNPTKAKQIEIYPPSSQAETYDIITHNLPEQLTLDDVLPPEIDPGALREGVLLDIYVHNAEEAANATPPDYQRAQYYQQQAIAQRVIWDRAIAESAKSDKATTDTSIITYSEDDEEAEFRDIATAYDQVWTTEHM